MATHTTKDGNIWKTAVFKGKEVWVRVSAEDDMTPYVSVSGLTDTGGKACVKYQNTPKAKVYWCTPSLVDIKAPGVGWGRRSKRHMGEEERAAAAKEEEEQMKLPQPAGNSKLYGVMLGSTCRKEWVQKGKDAKEMCDKCGKSLDAQQCIGFVEAERSKTVKRRYGEDPRDSKLWSKSFSYMDRTFTCLPCWDIPKTAQRTMRGLMDISGYAALPDDLKLMVCDKLGWEEDPPEAAPSQP